MENRYAKDCNECDVWVDVSEGHVEKEGNEWVTYCESCHSEVDPVIAITLHSNGREAIAKPSTFLGHALFQEYKESCDEAGTRYSSALKATVVPMDSLARLAKEFKSRGFTVTVSDKVKDALSSFASSARKEMESTEVRIDQVNSELEKRGEALFGYQVEGVSWLAARSGAMLNDDMGLGKSAQALVSVPEGTPILIVGPAVAKGVWVRECKRWRPDLKPVALKGRASFRWPKPGEMVVTNYDILPEIEKGKTRRDVRESCPKGVVVIADEAQALKNNKAKRTKRFRVLADYARKVGGKVWLLTATPVKNRPGELWALLQAAGIAAEAFSNWATFVELFRGEKGQWGGYEWGKPSKEVAERLKRVSLRREKKDVLKDLPPKIYSIADVEIDKKTKSLCDSIVTAIKDAGIDLDKAVAAADDAALRGVAFEEISATRAALAIAKIPHLLRMVEPYEDSEEPLVVFSAHRAPIDILGERDGWAVITGSTPPAKRTKIEDDFQAGKLKGIAATIQAGGTAITLTHASHVIFVDLGWTPADNAQAEDRLCRIGQTLGVHVIRLVADHPLDRGVTALLHSKQMIISGSIEASTRKPGARIDDRATQLENASSEIADLADVVPSTPAAEESSPTEAPETPVERSEKKSPPSRRQAQNDQERWADQAIRSLAANDQDRASEENGVGFNRLDGAFGHSLASQMSLEVGLTDKQWRAAIKMSKKYRRQVGECP